VNDAIRLGYWRMAQPLGSPCHIFESVGILTEFSTKGRCVEQP